jgi:hypothetical protein
MNGVPASLTYLAPGSVRNAQYVAPADHLATVRYEQHGGAARGPL